MVYKFRFVSAGLLAQYYGKHVSVINRSLEVLIAHKLLDRRYSSEFRIQGKGACYSLSNAGIAYWREAFDKNESVLHIQYKNKTVGQPYIDQTIEAMRAFLAIRNSYPDKFHIFTKSDAAVFDYFPNPKPDLYLSSVDKNQPDYFLELFSDHTQSFVIKKRLKQILEHYDDGEWESSTGAAYPGILLVMPNARMEKTMQIEAQKMLENAGIDELQILVTTQQALRKSTVGEHAIWTNVSVHDSLLGL